MYSLLITGLFRDPENFKRMLQEWSTPGSEVAEIVVSTWPSERDSFASLFSGLSFNIPSVQIIVNQEPLFEFSQPKSLTHQLHTLINGLMFCSQPWVFKIRTDFYARFTLAEKLRCVMTTDATGPMQEFQNKLWVPWIDYEEPFHIADEAIFASRHDLLKIASRGVSELSEVGFPLVNLHTILFRPSYEITGRIFRDWLMAQRDSGVILNDPMPSKFDLLERLLECNAFQAMIGCYHRYLSDNFFLASEDGELEFKPTGGANGAYYQDRQLENEIHPKLFERKLAGFHNHFYAWSQDSLERLFKDAKQMASMNSYRLSFQDPASVIATSDDRYYSEFIEVLRYK